MVVKYLRSCYAALLSLTDKITLRKNWKIELALLSPFISLFFSFPSYEFLQHGFDVNWQFVFLQSQHPFTDFHYSPESHQAKLTFRLLMPLIIRFLHLNIYSTLYLTAFLGIITVYLFIKTIEKITSSKRIIFLMTLSFLFINSGSASVCQINGMFDSVGFFFLMIPMAFSNPFLIFTGIFLGSWVDERVLIASSLLFVWYAFTINNRKAIHSFAILLAWSCYFILRLYITNKFNLQTQTEGLGPGMLIAQINNIPTGIYSGLEGFWLLIILGGIVFRKERKYLPLFTYIGCIIIIILVSLSVYDISRSMMYLFPAIFIAFYKLHSSETEDHLTKMIMVVLVLCFVFPVLSASGYNSIMWQYPLPLQILRYVLNYSGLI